MLCYGKNTAIIDCNQVINKVISKEFIFHKTQLLREDYRLSYVLVSTVEALCSYFKLLASESAAALVVVVMWRKGRGKSKKASPNRPRRVALILSEGVTLRGTRSGVQSSIFHKCKDAQILLAVAIACLVQYENLTFMPPRRRSDEREVEALRELLKCIESALKSLEQSDNKGEPRLKTVRVNLQVSRNLVRHFLSNLGAQYPPP